ncbi:hypothetical protein J6590_009136 [Homalodisca vitripennis]|nr:hypothetical protein J6590_009136 [Homalodisca vitripennis]
MWARYDINHTQFCTHLDNSHTNAPKSDSEASALLIKIALCHPLIFHLGYGRISTRAIHTKINTAHSNAIRLNTLVLNPEPNPIEYVDRSEKAMAQY